jgi:hypothetical protein
MSPAMAGLERRLWDVGGIVKLLEEWKRRNDGEGDRIIILTVALALPVGIGLGVPSVWDQRHSRPLVRFWLLDLGVCRTTFSEFILGS